MKKPQENKRHEQAPTGTTHHRNSRTLPTAMASPTVKMAGYLDKRGKRLPTWKQYWFVLDGRLLLYFRSQFDYLQLSPCQGSYNLGLVSAIRPKGSRRSPQLEITTRSQLILLRASDRESQERWLKALLEAIQGPSATDENNAQSHFRYATASLPHTLPERKSADEEVHVDSACASETMPRVLSRIKKMGNESFEELAAEIRCKGKGSLKQVIPQPKKEELSSRNKGSEFTALLPTNKAVLRLLERRMEEDRDRDESNSDCAKQSDLSLTTQNTETLVDSSEDSQENEEAACQETIPNAIDSDTSEDNYSAAEEINIVYDNTVNYSNDSVEEIYEEMPTESVNEFDTTKHKNDIPLPPRLNEQANKKSSVKFSEPAGKKTKKSFLRKMLSKRKEKKQRCVVSIPSITVEDFDYNDTKRVVDPDNISTVSYEYVDYEELMRLNTLASQYSGASLDDATSMQVESTTKVNPKPELGISKNDEKLPLDSLRDNYVTVNITQDKTNDEHKESDEAGIGIDSSTCPSTSTNDAKEETMQSVILLDSKETAIAQTEHCDDKTLHIVLQVAPCDDKNDRTPLLEALNDNTVSSADEDNKVDCTAMVNLDEFRITTSNSDASEQVCDESTTVSNRSSGSTISSAHNLQHLDENDTQLIELGLTRIRRYPKHHSADELDILLRQLNEMKSLPLYSPSLDALGPLRKKRADNEPDYDVPRPHRLSLLPVTILSQDDDDDVMEASNFLSGSELCNEKPLSDYLQELETMSSIQQKRSTRASQAFNKWLEESKEVATSMSQNESEQDMNFDEAPSVAVLKTQEVKEISDLESTHVMKTPNCHSNKSRHSNTDSILSEITHQAIPVQNKVAETIDLSEHLLPTTDIETSLTVPQTDIHEESNEMVANETLVTKALSFTSEKATSNMTEYVPTQITNMNKEFPTEQADLDLQMSISNHSMQVVNNELCLPESVAVQLKQNTWNLPNNVSSESANPFNENSQMRDCLLCTVKPVFFDSQDNVVFETTCASSLANNLDMDNLLCGSDKPTDPASTANAASNALSTECNNQIQREPYMAHEDCQHLTSESESHQLENGDEDVSDSILQLRSKNRENGLEDSNKSVNRSTRLSYAMIETEILCEEIVHMMETSETEPLMSTE